MQQQFRGYAPQAPGPRGGGAHGGQHGVPQRRGGIGPMMHQGVGPHASVPMTQAQIHQENQRREMATQLAKLRSRKPTDKSLPDGVEEILVGDGDVAQAYKSLRDFERRLDATMTRKRLDIVDSVNRNPKRFKTLRIWIKNTVEDQFWQNNLDVNSFDFSENLESSYRVKIEGRLLDDDEDNKDDDETKGAENKEDGDKMETDSPNKTKTGSKPASAKPGERYRFSHFFKALTVDFDRPRSGRSETSVEWKKPDRLPAGSNLPAAADFDEFTFRRNGDENVNITINLFRHEDPERFELSPELAEVIDMKEATRQEAVMGLWEYIKLMNLQEDEEKRNFRCDDLLKRVIAGRDSGHIPLLNEYVTPHLKPLPPIKLPYTIRVDEEFHKSGDPVPTIYDIRVAVDDPLKAKLLPFVRDTQYASMLKEIAGLDDQLATIIQAIAQSKSKHTFLSGMANDPVHFVRDWLSSQKRDLDIIMGESTRGAGQEATGDEWRRGGKNSIWGTPNARESVAVLLSKQPVLR